MDIIHISWKYPPSLDIIRISWIYPHFVDNIRISWKYPYSIDIIRILCKYPRPVDIILISWIYPHFVDIIRIRHITSYLARNACHGLHSFVLVVNVIYSDHIMRYLVHNFGPIFHIYSFSESD